MLTKNEKAVLAEKMKRLDRSIAFASAEHCIDLLLLGFQAFLITRGTLIPLIIIPVLIVRMNFVLRYKNKLVHEMWELAKFFAD